MTYRPTLRVQLTMIITVVAFVLATMAPLNAAPRISPKAPAAKPDQPVSKTQSVSSFVQGATSGGTFYGIVSISQFAAVNGVLTAAGTFTGFVTPSGGSATAVTQNFTGVPVTAVDPSCSILTLTLGPLNLNLLGRLAPDIDLLYCELPENLKTEVNRIRITSRRELGV